MMALLKIALVLFCIAVSAAFVFFGGATLMWTLFGFYWLAPLIMLLYGLSNLFLTVLAFSTTNRHVVRVSAIASSVAALAVVAGYVVGGLTQREIPWMLAWCAALVFNWLSIRAMVHLRAASNAIPGA